MSHRSHAFRTITLCALAGFLSGCTMGGKYQRPELDLPAEWRWQKPAPATKVADAVPPAQAAPIAQAAPAKVTEDTAPAQSAPVAAPVVNVVPVVQVAAATSEAKPATVTETAAPLENTLPTPLSPPVPITDLVAERTLPETAPAEVAASNPAPTPAETQPTEVAVAVAPAPVAPAEPANNTAPAVAAAPVAEAVPDPEWWKAFNDPKLNELEQAALDANQDIRLAIARVDEARATARVKKADFYPELSINPSATRMQNSAHGFLIGGGNVNEDSLRKIHNSFALPMDFSYEIDVWGRIKHTYAASRKRAEATVADYGAVTLAVTSDIAVNYFLLQALDSQLQILIKTRGLRETTLKLSKVQLDNGKIPAQDLARSKAEVSNADAQIADLKRQREEVSNVIAILCGKPASNFSLETKPLTAQPPAIPAGLPSSLLTRRPDIVKAERTLAAAHDEIRVAHTAFFPRISLTARGGLESAELSNFVSLPSTLWNFGANLIQPVFEGGRNKANLEAAKARYDQNVAQYRQQVLVAFKDTEDALLDIQFRAEQAKALDESVKASKDVVEKVNLLFENGQNSNFELVDAQRQQLAVELQAAQVLGQRLIASVRLVKALGGGWKMEVPEKK